MRQEPQTPTMCDRCGNRFNTSEVHPRKYCSIACEEGRSPLPDSDPASGNYHLHLQGKPEALVGKWLVARGLKRTCYSPEWHRGPDGYNNHQIVEHDVSNEIITYKTDVVLGQVDEYANGAYRVRYDEQDGGISHYRWHDASMVVDQIKEDNWWVDG